MSALSHAELRALLPSYAAGHLTPTERTTIQAHLATCDDCRAELTQWQIMNGWLAQAEATIPPDQGAARSLAAIHARLGRTAGANTVEQVMRRENLVMPYQNNPPNPPYPSDRPYSGSRPYPGASSPPNPNDRPYPGDRLYPEANPYPDERAHPGSHTYPGYGADASRYSTSSPRRSPTPPAEQRRATPWIAAGSVVIFLALIAGLFYWLSPLRNPNKPANNATPTVTLASTPTPSPVPTSGSWAVVTSVPTTLTHLMFASSTPQFGYYCDATLPANASSTQWLYRSDDGGMSWRGLSGLTSPSESTPVPPSVAYTTASCDVLVDNDNANDVFVELMTYQLPAPGGIPPASNTLWRSQDGGATWSQLTAPPVVGETTGVLQSIVVAGSRLIGLESDQTQAVAECATDPNADSSLHVNDLVASDDGGKIWNTIGQSIYNQGLSISDKGGWIISGQPIQRVDGAIYIQAHCESYANGSSVDRASDWISHDNGSTWSQLPVNGGSDVEGFQYMLAPSSSVYGLAVDFGSSGSSRALPTLRYSNDSGASWRALPSLSFAQGVAANPKLSWSLLLPDGTVLISLMNGTTPLGAFVIDPNSAKPAWAAFSMTPDNIIPGGWQSSPVPISKTAQGLVFWAETLGGPSRLQQPTYYIFSPVP